MKKIDQLGQEEATLLYKKNNLRANRSKTHGKGFISLSYNKIFCLFFPHTRFSKVKSFFLNLVDFFQITNMKNLKLISAYMILGWSILIVLTVPMKDGLSLLDKILL